MAPNFDDIYIPYKSRIKPTPSLIRMHKYLIKLVGEETKHITLKELAKKLKLAISTAQKYLSDLRLLKILSYQPCYINGKYQRIIKLHVLKPLKMINK